MTSEVFTTSRYDQSLILSFDLRCLSGYLKVEVTYRKVSNFRSDLRAFELQTYGYFYNMLSQVYLWYTRVLLQQNHQWHR